MASAIWYGKAFVSLLGGSYTTTVDYGVNHTYVVGVGGCTATASTVTQYWTNWLTHNIKVMLCTSAYTPNRLTHQFKSDITHEITASGYTAGGEVLASKTVTGPDASYVVKFDAADVTWTNSTITARYAIIYNLSGTGGDVNKPLLAYYDFGSDVSSVAGTFTIQWDANGILKLTAA